MVAGGVQAGQQEHRTDMARVGSALEQAAGGGRVGWAVLPQIQNRLHIGGVRV